MLELLSLAGSAFSGAVQRVPRQLWYALAGLLALAGLIWWHQHAAHKAISAAEKRGAASAYASLEGQARAIEQRAAALNTQIRTANNATNRRITTDANTLRMRGPGRAACPIAASTPAGGHDAPARPADAPVDKVPNGGGVDLIAVPYADLVTYAEQHDLDIAEIIAWRTSDSAQRTLSVTPK